MKDMLFRGKRIDSGEWAYGNLIKDNGKVFIVEKVGYVSKENVDWASHYMECFVHEVIPETVGQYIGIKENSPYMVSEKIFEGDIIRVYGGEYCQGCWEFDGKITIRDITKDVHIIDENSYIQIVGNIHDKEE